MMTIATADPTPTSKDRKNLSYMKLASTCVSHWPLVMARTMSNTFSTVMVIVVQTTTMVPMICGTLILKKIWNGPAPSRIAASIVSSGMPRRAADRITMAKPA